MNATTAAILRTAPAAKPQLKIPLFKETHGLLQANTERITCIKKDYPFRCTKESVYATMIDHYRRTTRQLLPEDPIFGRQICEKFFYRGWCVVGCPLPNHQLISKPSAAAMTDFGGRARAWAAVTPPTADDLAHTGKRKWEKWDETAKCITATTPAPSTPVLAADP